MKYYGRKCLGLIYRRLFGVDQEGISFGGKYYQWSAVSRMRARNTDYGVIFTMMLGQPRSEVEFADGAVISIYPTELIEEDASLNREFTSGITQAYRLIEIIFVQSTGQAWQQW